MTADGLENANLAFGLVIVAGLSTAIGAVAVYFQRLVQLASKLVLAAGLGFSAGVMLYVSFVEIFVKSHEAFAADGREERDAYYCATLCLFSGMVLMWLIAVLVHKLDSKHDHCCDVEGVSSGGIGTTGFTIDIDTLANAVAEGGDGSSLPLPPAEGAAPCTDEHPSTAVPAETNAKATDDKAESKANDQAGDKQLMRMGVKTALAIAIHNFPEGLATFVATLADPAVGITLAVAIAIHNIPEGLCVALPVYYATGSRTRGFLWALFSGLSEPIGAILGYVLIKSTGEDMNQVVYGILFGIVSGMMIMIVIMELAPTGFRYDPQDKVFSLSVATGMAVMAMSLCLFMS